MTERQSKKNASGIYNVEPHRAFPDALAQGVLARTGNDPLKLADYTILVPDRAAAASLRQSFILHLQGKPALLPRIETPGDMEDEDMGLRLSGNRILSEALMDIPPAVSRLERQLILAAEILKIPGMASSVQKAVTLGGELGQFLDLVQRHNIELGNIDALVPPQFRAQWQKTADFLRIITETWPQYLEKEGKIDPEERKNAMILLQAEHWRRHPPARPVIAAGFAGTEPALLDLLHAVKGLPQGAIIMQGVDTALDSASWDRLTEVHPQHTYKVMLKTLGEDRAAIPDWQQAGKAPPRSVTARRALLREAMRPAAGSVAKNPKKKPSFGKESLAGLNLVSCGTPQEEASVIALKIRESLEAPNRTVALVTADRALARRVIARLRHWNIAAEDSAGAALSETGAGRFLLATAGMAAADLAPVAFLEAMKHPLSALSEDKDGLRAHVTLLEDLVLHGPRPAGGLSGLRHALTAAFNRSARRTGEGAALERLSAEQGLSDWLDRLEKSGAAFFGAMVSPKPVSFSFLLEEHIRFAEALAETATASGKAALWSGADGVKAARFLSGLRDLAGHLPPMTGRDYADVLTGLMRETRVRPDRAAHPALKIMTPEQALLSAGADTVILGGLNDEVWPPRPDENPWLSPDMLRALGLPAPESVIGDAAHRFVQLVSKPEVMLTRSARDGASPAVASPLLTRLLTVLKGAGIEKGALDKTPLLDIHIAMHTPAEVTPVEPPAPAPPVARRPKQLSVTAVETLMRDPYSVYARYVLDLRPRQPLDASPGVAERGIFTHAALDAFVKKYPEQLPDNAYEELLKIGAETFESRMDSPAVRAFWWPRFERIAAWFVRFEQERREVMHTAGTEVRGKLEIDLGDSVFTLTTIADRIDADPDGKLSIIDYKTGTVPAQKDVASGLSSQLVLEAYIVLEGGFPDVPAAEIGQLQYWKLSGGRPAAEVTDVRADVARLVAEARDGLRGLMQAFNDPATPYLATPRPEAAPRYNNYEHLSRVAEWSTVRKSDGKKRVRSEKTKTRSPSPGRKAGRG